MNFTEFLELNPAFYYVIVGVLGLLVGSFLNVVIYRLPAMMEREWRTECSRLLEIAGDDTPASGYNLVYPASACPHCNHKISALENIPIISFIFLHGRCRECGGEISWRYPLVEAISCLLSLYVAIYFGLSIQAVFAILLTWVLIALTFIDYDHQLLPDSITLPFLWLGIICNLYGIFTDLHSSVLGAIAGYLSLWFVYIAFKLVTGKQGMGHGDFKLLALLGAWLGWQFLPLIIIISSILGAATGLALMLFAGRTRTQAIPFGPFLAVAGWVALIHGDSLMRVYFLWALP